MPKITPEIETFARIRVVGVGGSGKNATNHMVNSHVKGVDFIAINTDAQDLQNSLAKKKIHIGKNLTRGLGTGMNPDLGRRAAEETKEEIQEALKGADMVFIAGGMGGGTGTGSAPIVAQTAKELGALTVAVVTKPFSFEGSQRNRLAEAGLEELRKQVDALIVIPNDRILATVSKDTRAKDAFAMSDDILRQAVEGISDLITTPGTINVDFADIRSVMENAGSALMGIGTASGDNRAVEAAKAAINSPLLDISIHNAKGVLFAVAGGDDLGMLEIQDAAKIITESIDPNARVIFGTIFDEKLKKNEIRVTVIATGFPDPTNLTRETLFPGRPAFVRPQEEEKKTGFFSTTTASTIQVKDREEKKVEMPSTSVAQTTPPTTTPAPTKDTKPLPDEDNDDWGAVPAFLRRNKK